GDTGMTPHVVADIGNTRIKWGLASDRPPWVLRTVALPDDPERWQRELTAWRESGSLPAHGPLTWVLASVVPQLCDRLRGWLEARGHGVLLLNYARQLPLEVTLEKPDHVGIDRLLDAVAAKGEVAPGRGAVLIDAGSAVTIDWLDEQHRFAGGPLLPRPALMGQALPAHTPLLPPVSGTSPVPAFPALSTPTAMQAGMFLAVSGAVRESVRLFGEGQAVPPRVFFTGGDAPLLWREMGLEDPGGRAGPWADALLWPHQTLV